MPDPRYEARDNLTKMLPMLTNETFYSAIAWGDLKKLVPQKDLDRHTSNLMKYINMFLANLKITDSMSAILFKAKKNKNDNKYVLKEEWIKPVNSKSVIKPDNEEKEK